MNYLLDTNTFLWAAFAPSKLSSSAKKQIRSAENRVCLSTITFWEISLKFALGKIELKNSKPDEMPDIATQMGIEIIQPTVQETATFYQLPKLQHKDPFDRMIIWQSIQQQLVLISKDSDFAEYSALGLRVLW